MIFAGKKITSSSDQLAKISLDYLYHSIKNPKGEIEAKIRQLRIVRDIDKKSYALLKKELPYIVCGVFNPAFRRTDNFAYIEYFIVDIDHITQKGLSVKQIRQDIEKDSRTLLSFISPGEDGLKVMFHLKERCYDHGIYSLFYKSFILKFSQTYHIEQVIDAQTSDVCRACFISCDPDVYFNPEAEGIDLNTYLDINNPSALFDLKKQTVETLPLVDNVDIKENKDPDDEAIQRIKDILKFKSKPAEKIPVYIPEQLNEIIQELKIYIEETGIVVTEIINISYGKKIRMKLGLKQAEINLFYGKRGFSVVESPRCGTNSELNMLTVNLINGFLAQ
ncbi:CRISPR-associated primase-polymerase type B [Parabacteroides sp. Marseille-P3160]|uniref:CRISPR-associated primase-polymerase type B n=1 Tax=Parabacteroides sp. Marseille-P3160 TaxID=1917887 RepID=UPI0009B9B815|nr:CRISPR-associated primase-polymerase type B [Parabacteroides sp. Marseille-P3160]